MYMIWAGRASAATRFSFGCYVSARPSWLYSFGLDLCCDELAAGAAPGREYDVPFELSALVERIHQRALARFGPADGELLDVTLLEEEAAGIRLRHGPALISQQGRASRVRAPLTGRGPRFPG